MKRVHARWTEIGLIAGGLGLMGLASTLPQSTERAAEAAVEAAVEAVAAAGGAAATAGEARTAGGASSSSSSWTRPASGAGLGPEWDLPNLDHPRVDYWIARFDTVADMREKFQGFLDRGGEYAPMILERLEARGMPLDLLYLAMIESGFEPAATSHAAAVGVWQFVPATARQFGLAIDRAVDERRDPIKATDAALDYLERLHRRFGSWYLAAAAYNAGQGRISRIMRQAYGRERARSEQEYYRIWSRLPRETRDYVPLMIAAGRIAKDPEAYGFQPLVPAPRQWDEVTVPPATELERLAREFHTTVAEIRALNPQLLIHRTPNDRDYAVRLPAGSLARLAQAERSGVLRGGAAAGAAAGARGGVSPARGGAAR
jgi:membrane-bound lytic murein transglycosylase D